MDKNLYSSIISQLAEISYQGVISYSRYNEPLADKRIVECIREARGKLPNALLHTNTNGDYLDPDYLDELDSAGLRSLNIQFYLKNDERYDHEAVKARAQRVVKRLKLPFELLRDEPGVWFEYKFPYRDMAIRGYGRNFELNGTNRGDEVDIRRDYVRTSPCLMPFWSVYVDYNGSLMPCCNLRSDIEAHRDYVVGDLAAYPELFLSYSNARATAFRRSLLGIEAKEGLCRSCYFALEQPSESDIDLMNRLLKEQTA